jgi:hypothetical protein
LVNKAYGIIEWLTNVAIDDNDDEAYERVNVTATINVTDRKRREQMA